MIWWVDDLKKGLAVVVCENTEQMQEAFETLINEGVSLSPGAFSNTKSLITHPTQYGIGLLDGIYDTEIGYVDIDRCDERYILTYPDICEASCSCVPAESILEINNLKY